MPRPKAEIDWIEVGKLLEAGCNGAQCASYFGVDAETLYNRCKTDLKIGFTEYLRQKRAKGDALILAKQFEAALKDKDRGMLIWLGKQRLDQKDTRYMDHKSDGKQIGFPLLNIDPLADGTESDNSAKEDSES